MENKKESIDLSGMLKRADAPMPERRQFSYPPPLTPKVIVWTMKYSGGLIKNERHAAWAVLGFVALLLTITLFLLFRGGNPIPPFEGGSNPQFQLPRQ